MASYQSSENLHSPKRTISLMLRVGESNRCTLVRCRCIIRLRNARDGVHRPFWGPAVMELMTSVKWTVLSDVCLLR